jgi:hypothetical protein
MCVHKKVKLLRRRKSLPKKKEEREKLHRQLQPLPTSVKEKEPLWFFAEDRR